MGILLTEGQAAPMGGMLGFGGILIYIAFFFGTDVFHDETAEKRTEESCGYAFCP